MVKEVNMTWWWDWSAKIMSTLIYNIKSSEKINLLSQISTNNLFYIC